MLNLRYLSLVALFGILLCGCAGSSEPTKRSDLEREFQDEFGFAPSQQVVELRCRSVWIGDTWSKWMLFTGDDSTVQAIIGKGFALADPDTLTRGGKIWARDIMTGNPNAPEWWRSPSSGKVRVYYKEGHPADHAGYRCFWIDDDSKRVYAKFAAWH